MVIFETTVFTKIIMEILDDGLYRELQQELCIRPESGDLIQGTHGLRKIRWKTKGQGKRGSVRVIYYWYESDSKIYMLYAYKKNKQAKLTIKVNNQATANTLPFSYEGVRK